MKRVLIYCANGYGERVAYAIDDQFEVIGFTDGNEESFGQEIAGYRVAPLCEWGGRFDYVVIATAAFADLITERLLSEGVKKEQIIVFEDQLQGFKWEEERIICMRRCLDLIQERSIPGSMAEVGVYRGDFARLINKHMPEKRIYLFDTFEGFDKERDTLIEGHEAEFRDTSVEFVLSRMAFPDKCLVRKGYFPDTAVDIDETFCFVSLDCDLYEPIKAGLDYFFPRLEHGGFIFIHDFGSFAWSGVREAVMEYCDTNGIGFFPLVDRGRSVVILK